MGRNRNAKKEPQKSVPGGKPKQQKPKQQRGGGHRRRGGFRRAAPENAVGHADNSPHTTQNDNELSTMARQTGYLAHPVPGGYIASPPAPYSPDGTGITGLRNGENYFQVFYRSTGWPLATDGSGWVLNPGTQPGVIYESIPQVRTINGDFEHYVVPFIENTFARAYERAHRNKFNTRSQVVLDPIRLRKMIRVAIGAIFLWQSIAECRAISEDGPTRGLYADWQSDFKSASLTARLDTIALTIARCNLPSGFYNLIKVLFTPWRIGNTSFSHNDQYSIIVDRRFNIDGQGVGWSNAQVFAQGEFFNIAKQIQQDLTQYEDIITEVQDLTLPWERAMLEIPVVRDSIVGRNSFEWYAHLNFPTMGPAIYNGQVIRPLAYVNGNNTSLGWMNMTPAEAQAFEKALYLFTTHVFVEEDGDFRQFPGLFAPYGKTVLDYDTWVGPLGVPSGMQWNTGIIMTGGYSQTITTKTRNITPPIGQFNIGPIERYMADVGLPWTVSPHITITPANPPIFGFDVFRQGLNEYCATNDIHVAQFIVEGVNGGDWNKTDALLPRFTAGILEYCLAQDGLQDFTV